MNICKKCRSTDIRSRRNYSHGNKSKGTTSMSCRACGHTDIEKKSENRRPRRQKR